MPGADTAGGMSYPRVQAGVAVGMGRQQHSTVQSTVETPMHLTTCTPTDGSRGQLGQQCPAAAQTAAPIVLSSDTTPVLTLHLVVQPPPNLALSTVPPQPGRQSEQLPGLDSLPIILRYPLPRFISTRCSQHSPLSSPTLHHPASHPSSPLQSLHQLLPLLLHPLLAASSFTATLCLTVMPHSLRSST